MSDSAPKAQTSPPERRWNAGRSLAEVVLIALGVFLGLAAEQWRDRADRNERAAETLRRIRAEMIANRDEVNKVIDYHSKKHPELKNFLAMPVAKRDEMRFGLEGIQPAQFEQTAWQLALATQALVDIDPDLAFDLARIYGVQARYLGLTVGVTEAMYVRPPSENSTSFLHSLSVYYSDIVELEPGLVKLYDEMLPRIDRALGR
jgi:hypothetical protein